MRKTVFYFRTSTSEQTIEHQLSQAKQAGFTFDDVIEDGLNVQMESVCLIY